MTSLTKVLKTELMWATQHGVEVILSPTETVRYGEEDFEVSGFFSDHDRLLSVAIGLPVDTWVSTFIHETCHMDQWIDRTELWTSISSEKDGIDLCTDFFDWLSGDEIENFDSLGAAHKIALLELDAEIRSIKKIERYGLTDLIPIEEYSQKANAYCYFYLWAQRNRRWYSPSTRPYMIKEIWSKAPNKLDPVKFSSWRSIPLDLEKAYYKYIRSES